VEISLQLHRSFEYLKLHMQLCSMNRFSSCYISLGIFLSEEVSFQLCLSSE
jgi:hypothetical protein